MPAKATKEQKPEIVTDALSSDYGIDFDVIELLFFAYRDFTSDPDAMLARSGFGRAHHRVVHFVNRHPGMTVADLLDTLKITKQSLARVLKELVDSGYINQVTGPEDRRKRRLYPTRKGRELALALAEPQSRRIAAALERAARKAPGMQDDLTRMETRSLVAEFLRGMIDTPSV